MLQIKKVKKYSAAKYPSEKYEKKEYNKLVYSFIVGGNSILALSLMQGCLTGGVDGNMIEPEIVKEDSARVVIERVFANYNITFTNDFVMQIPLEDNDTTTVDTASTIVSLDGYNPGLKVGYEYLEGYREDREENLEFIDDWRVEYYFRNQVLENEKYVPIFKEYYEKYDGLERLESDVQAFIDSLRTQGLI